MMTETVFRFYPFSVGHYRDYCITTGIDAYVKLTRPQNFLENSQENWQLHLSNVILSLAFDSHYCFKVNFLWQHLVWILALSASLILD